MIRTRRRAVICSLAVALTVSLAVAPGAAVPAGQGQEAVPGVVAMPGQWLQGYVKTVSGDTLVYPWAYPGQTRSLLSRATTGTMRVAWLGEPAPPGGADDRVTYLWHAGTASGSGAHAFTFAVNGIPVATFRSGRTPDDRGWSVTGSDGAVLSFRTTRIGTFGELFGFMWVTAPRSLFGAGAPQFSVTGEAAGSQDYYLGPEEQVRSFVRARAEQAVFVSGERAVRVEISSARNPEAVRIDTGGSPITAEAPPGYTSLLVPAGPNTDRAVTVSITAGSDAPVAQTIALKTVPDRALHLLPHSHVDIGYSDPQPEVERKQWKNLRDAVALARADGVVPARGAFQVERRRPVVGRELPEAGLARRSGSVSRGRAERHDCPPGQRRQPPHGPGHARGTPPLDGRIAPPQGRLRPRADADGDALRHSRPQLDVGGRPFRGRRALFQQRPELHAGPARWRRPHWLHAESPWRQAVLVGVAVGRGAAPLLDGRPRLLLVPRPQHGPHDRSQPRRRAASTWARSPRPAIPGTWCRCGTPSAATTARSIRRCPWR